MFLLHICIFEDECLNPQVSSVQGPGVQVAAGWRLSCSFNVATDELLQGLRAVQVTSDLQLRPADRTHPQCIHRPWRSGSATLTREPPTNTPSQEVGEWGGSSHRQLPPWPPPNNSGRFVCLRSIWQHC